MNTIEQRVRNYFEVAISDGTEQGDPTRAAAEAISAARVTRPVERRPAPLLAGVAVLAIAVATTYLFTVGHKGAEVDTAGSDPAATAPAHREASPDRPAVFTALQRARFAQLLAALLAGQDVNPVKPYLQRAEGYSRTMVDSKGQSKTMSAVFATPDGNTTYRAYASDGHDNDGGVNCAAARSFGAVECKTLPYSTGTLTQEIFINRELSRASRIYEALKGPPTVSDLPDLRVFRTTTIIAPDGTKTAYEETVHGPKSLNFENDLVATPQEAVKSVLALNHVVQEKFEPMKATVTPTPSAKEQLAVTRFVHEMRSVGEVEVDAEWSKGILLLAVQDPRRPGFRSVDGQTVGGLRVTLIHSSMSRAEYAAAIMSINAAKPFAASDRIQGFGFAPDGSYLQVHVRGSKNMTDQERSTLVERLEHISATRVVIDDPGKFRSLVGTDGR